MNNNTDSSPLFICKPADDTSVGIISFSIPVLAAAQNEQLTAEFLALTAQNKYDNYILDLSSIKMLSSQTLSVFLQLRKLVETRGKIAISGIDPDLYRVFKITGLHNLFLFLRNNEEAVQAF